MQNTPHKYLFTATFEDGRVIKQTIEDKSELDPEKRNTFYDVLEHIKTTKLVAFVLKAQDAAGIEYGVDLRDGHFEVDGNIFFMHEVENKDLDPMHTTQGMQFKDFRLVFFTTNTRSFATQMGNVEVKPYQTSHTRVYRFGWQATDAKGKNYQQIMQID